MKTRKNIHFRKMNGLWWCRAPYDPTVLEQAQSATGKTPLEAYKNLTDLTSSPDFIPPQSTPRSRQLHRLWQDAELRARNGMLNTHSSLDASVRSGGLQHGIKPQGVKP